MARNHIRTILAQLTDEAQHTLKTARIDLDAFLALSGEERAARWRGWDRAAKWQAVAQMLERRVGGWDVDAVEYWIGQYDAKWGDAPTVMEAAVYGALDDLDEQARRAEELGDAADAAYFAAERRAIGRARAMYQAGARPEQLTGGDWRVPSASGNGSYGVTRLGACDCQAGQHSLRCKHAVLIAAVELGLERLSDHDAPTAEDLALARQLLAGRLVKARAKVMEAA